MELRSIKKARTTKHNSKLALSALHACMEHDVSYEIASLRKENIIYEESIFTIREFCADHAIYYLRMSNATERTPTIDPAINGSNCLQSRHYWHTRMVEQQQEIESKNKQKGYSARMEASEAAMYEAWKVNNSSLDISTLEYQKGYNVGCNAILSFLYTLTTIGEPKDSVALQIQPLHYGKPRKKEPLTVFAINQCDCKAENPTSHSRSGNQEPGNDPSRRNFTTTVHRPGCKIRMQPFQSVSDNRDAKFNRFACMQTIDAGTTFESKYGPEYTTYVDEGCHSSFTFNSSPEKSSPKVALKNVLGYAAKSTLSQLREKNHRLHACLNVLTNISGDISSFYWRLVHLTLIGGDSTYGGVYNSDQPHGNHFQELIEEVASGTGGFLGYENPANPPWSHSPQFHHGWNTAVKVNSELICSLSSIRGKLVSTAPNSSVSRNECNCSRWKECCACDDDENSIRSQIWMAFSGYPCFES